MFISIVLFVSNQTARPDFVSSVELPTRHLSGQRWIMMTYSNSPHSGRQVAYSVTRSLRCRTTVVIRHTCMGFPALPQLSAATELFIINLVAQHDPKPDAQFTCRRDPRLAHSFLDEFATIEAFQLRVLRGRM